MALQYDVVVFSQWGEGGSAIILLVRAESMSRDLHFLSDLTNFIRFLLPQIQAQ